MTRELVTLACPACGATWLAAEIQHGAWWAVGISAETIAQQCYCRSCQQPPPMRVVVEARQDMAEWPTDLRVREFPQQAVPA